MVQISFYFPYRAAAAIPVGIIPALAGVHRCYQHKICRKQITSCISGYTDFPFLQRLAQYLQRVLFKFRKLIQIQHSSMSQTHLSRFGTASASCQGNRRYGMMGGAKRPHRPQTHFLRKDSSDTVQLGNLQSFLQRCLGQYGGDSPGGHRLSRTWRANDQQIVQSRNRNFRSPAQKSLSLHF